MLLRRFTLAGVMTLVLTTCASCQSEAVDSDGDGEVTLEEMFSAARDFLCGGQTGVDPSEDENSDDGSANEPLPDETSAEVPTDEAVAD